MKFKNCWLHFKTVTKHKWYVFKACWDCGIVWRGIKHDLSKYSPTEFVSSAMYFQGNKSPIHAEKIEKGYSIAWQHHKGHNTHHWQYWLDNKDKEIIPLKMPYDDMIELVCDWVGAGKSYNKDKWTKYEPINYWNKNKDKMMFHKDTYEILERIFIWISIYGLDVVFSLIKEHKLEY